MGEDLVFSMLGFALGCLFGFETKCLWCRWRHHKCVCCGHELR